MPREPSAKYDLHANSHYYTTAYNQPQATGMPYMEPQQIMPVIQDPVPKKKHICTTCDKQFTTSGHLARHARVHTGEKNHKCPFPGCETRCSRQDNLQQHYRIHLSPGSRRTSTSASRSAMIKSFAGSKPSSHGGKKRGAQPAIEGPYSLPPPPPPPSPPLAPPALEQAHSRDLPPGPDSPPALVQANLPGMVPAYAESGSSRSASPPEYSLPPDQAHDYLPVATYPMGVVTQHSQNAQYSGTAPAYQEQSQGAIYAYDSESSLSQSNSVSGSTQSDDVHGQRYAYSHPYDHSQTTSHVSSSPVQHLQHANISHTHTPPISSSSQYARHSIPDLSRSHSYSHPPPPSTGPPSPTSVRSGSSHPSQASAPHTPSYVYQDDIHDTNGYHSTEHIHPPPSAPPTPAYVYREDIHKNNGYHVPEAIPEASGMPTGYYNAQADVANGYPPALPQQQHPSFSDRYEPSPPLLSPTQERLVHDNLHRLPHSSSPNMTTSSVAAALSPYLHHPRPIPGAYQNNLPHMSLQPVDWGRPQVGMPIVHN